jgi:hypothetical protein
MCAVMYWSSHLVQMRQVQLIRYLETVTQDKEKYVYKSS